jgi:hypothetical protein
VTWPAFGLNPDPYAFSRLALYAATAALTARIGARAGLGPVGQLFAGLFVAASPFAFTPLYWAAGIQELLGVVLLLAAIERWLAGGRANLLMALLAGVGAILAKESALGLPVALALATLFGRRPRACDGSAIWLAIVLLAVVSSGEILLVLRAFRTEAGAPYELGDLTSLAGNLGLYGRWLVTLGPTFAYRTGTADLIAGLGVWFVWGLWGFWRFRGGNLVPLAGWVMALLALAPALALRHHAYPYLGLVAVPALALTLGDLWPRHWTPRIAAVPFATVVVALIAYLVMDARLSARDPNGLPTDQLVRRTAVSYAACRQLASFAAREAPDAASRVIILTPPANREEAKRAAAVGETVVPGTLLYESLGGVLGPRLVLGGETEVQWRTGLLEAPTGAHVWVDAGTGLRPWGSTRQALLNLALTEVARGQFERAFLDLRRAAWLHEGDIAFLADPDVWLEPPSALRARRESFLDFLASTGASGVSEKEIAGLQQIFRELVAIVSGDVATDAATDSLAAPR